MTKTHGRRQSPGILGLLLLSVLFVCPCAFALDRALDVSQYAHTAWKIRDGFTKGLITSIAQTSDGYLWLGTEFGLYRFDGVRAAPWQPPSSEQLPSNYVRSLLASRDGTLWIGTFKGLASWTDGKLFRYSTPADQSVDALFEDDEGTIWVGTLGVPTRGLCTIRGGAIQCYGEDGSLGRWVDFTVAPAYYQTLWFRLSCVAALLAVLWGLYQLRLRQLSREFNAGVEARVNERTRIARELHDSLLQGFQGLIFRFQAAREFLPGRPKEATESLDIALKRADKVIIEGRDTISDLRQSAVGDSDIAQALTALGEELAAQSNNGAAPCVRVVVEGKQREIDPMLRDEIYLIAREALRNAFRHSKAQRVEAQITYGESEFLLHVRDDGIGMAPEVAHHGARAGHWGLPGMREELGQP